MMMRAVRRAIRLAALPALAAVVLTACAGAGARTAPPANQSEPRSAQVTLRIELPAKPSAGRRAPRFISPATQSVSVTITGPTGTTGPFVGNCAQGFCTQTVDAPIGTDTFSVALYDNFNAGGDLLSSGTAIVTIAAGQQNTVTITFNPVTVTANVGYQTFFSSPTFLSAGTPGSTAVTMTAKDPAGAPIAGPGNFETPTGAPVTVTVGLNDPSHHTALNGTTSYTAPQPNTTPPALTVQYDGTPPHFVYPQLTATVNGAAAPSTTLVIPPAPVASPVPLLPSGDRVTAMIKGPDGNIWFTADTVSGATDARVGVYNVTTGSVTQYPLPNADSMPNEIQVGGDGALWFFEQNRLRFARISTGGALTEFPSLTYHISTLVPGVDGNLWFFGGLGLEKIAPNGTITPVPIPENPYPRALVAGPNGRMWMITQGSYQGSAKLASVLPDGTGFTSTPITGFCCGSDLESFAAFHLGGDGNFYAGATGLYLMDLWRVTPSGSATELGSLGNHSGNGISTRLQDGTLIFYAPSFEVFGVVGPTGAYQRVSVQPPVGKDGIAQGGDGFLYVAGFPYGGPGNVSTLTKYTY
jgi:hypothetical protein